MNYSIYDRVLHFLAGIAIGFLLFSCKAPKPSCDAYSYVEDYKYCIEGKKIVEGDTVDVIAFTDNYLTTYDSVFYFNSDSSVQSILRPHTVYEN